MRILSLLMVASALLVSCSDKQKASQTAVEETSSAQVDSTVYIGESFEIEQVMAVNDLFSEVKAGDSAIVVARGKVKEVCQAKGCWMTLAMANDKSMRVTFKDYGFFMPKDLAGKEVIMKGTASYTTTDVATLQHLAADAGKTQEEIELITEPEEALTFLASGVTIVE